MLVKNYYQLGMGKLLDNHSHLLLEKVYAVPKSFYLTSPRSLL